MENFKSGISEEKRQSIKLAAEYVCNEFDKLVHEYLSNDKALNNETSKDKPSDDKALSKEEKKIEISELLDENEATKAYFSDLEELKNDYLNKNITEEEFKQRLEEQKKKAFEKISELREDAYASVAQKEERKNCKEALRSIGVNEEIVENLPSFQIDEVINNFSSPTINEDFLETLDDLNLPRKDADKIKKQYQYKVEGKITSGLSELDTFLGMIQPGLDLILKTGAKLFYEGIVDNVEKKFLGNDEQGVKSDFAIWAENKDGLKKSYDFLHKYGNLPETDTFKYRTNTIKDENHVATYFNQMIVDRINENNKNKKDENGNPIPKFKGNAFDETKNMDDTRQALEDIIKDVISRTRQKDSDGNPIAQPTDEGKAALNAIMYLTDLFNKKNSPEFKNQFAELINFYKSGYEEKFTGNFVEDDTNSYSEYEKQQKEDQKRYQAMLGDDGLDFISKQVAQGNSK